MRILVPKPGILVPKLQRLEGPSRSREEDEHVAGQRLRDVDLQRRHHRGLDVVRLGRLGVHDVHRVAPPRDVEDGRVVEVAAELGRVEGRARDEQLESSGQKRAMSLSSSKRISVCSVRSCASSRMMAEGDARSALSCLYSSIWGPTA